MTTNLTYNKWDGKTFNSPTAGPVTFTDLKVIAYKVAFFLDLRVQGTGDPDSKSTALNSDADGVGSVPISAGVNTASDGSPQGASYGCARIVCRIP